MSDKIKKMLEDQIAVASIGQMMGIIIVAVVTIVVALLLGSALLPGAVTGIANSSTNGTVSAINTSTWSEGTRSVWTAIPVFAVLAFFLLFIAVVLVVLKLAD